MKINFCKNDREIPHRMCICTASNQKDCIHYYKSSQLEQCMWKSIKLDTDNYHCSNPIAQKEARTESQQTYEEILIELEDQQLAV